MMKIRLISVLLLALVITTKSTVINLDKPSRIIDGTTTSPDVARRVFRIWNFFKFRSQPCSASLIMKGFLLTAAHCVHLLGENATTTQVQVNGEVLNAARYFMHKNYFADRFGGDIALIKTKEDLSDRKFGRAKFGLAKRPEQVPTNGMNVRVSGFGRTENGRHANEARESFVFRNDDECPANIRETTMFCGDSTGSSVICGGDSGGPAFVTVDDHRGRRYRQVGIIKGLARRDQSGGRAAPCGSKENLSTFVDVFNYRSDIFHCAFSGKCDAWLGVELA